jgi:uncharacterized membrane protein
VKLVLRWLLAIGMIGAGINHFRSADTYIAMMPEALPAHAALVYISGVAEILCGVGLLIERTRKFAAWSTIALLVAVFPANINMAVNNLPLGGEPVPTWILWARLPIQVVLIAWAYWYTRGSFGGREPRRTAPATGT